MTKTKIALAALLVAGTASAASAQGFDPNPANRYPAYAAPGATLRTAPVQLNRAARSMSRRARSRTTGSRLRLTPAALAKQPPANRRSPPRRFIPESSRLLPAALFLLANGEWRIANGLENTIRHSLLACSPFAFFALHHKSLSDSVIAGERS